MSYTTYHDEIKEAIDAADTALDHLHEALDLLDNASNWGLADMFVGGFFMTYVKRSRMHEAQAELNEARRALKRFSEELKDVDKHIDFNLNFDGFLGFADYFLDNFFTDLLVQNKITEAKTQVRSAIDQIMPIRDELEALL